MCVYVCLYVRVCVCVCMCVCVSVKWNFSAHFGTPLFGAHFHDFSAHFAAPAARSIPIVPAAPCPPPASLTHAGVVGPPATARGGPGVGTGIGAFGSAAGVHGGAVDVFGPADAGGAHGSAHTSFPTRARTHILFCTSGLFFF